MLDVKDNKIIVRARELRKKNLHNLYCSVQNFVIVEGI